MIPFCKTSLGEEEKKAVAEVIDSGWVVLGPKSKQFEEEFAHYVGSEYAVFVDSGTSALFLALQALKTLILPAIQGNNFTPVFRVPSLTFAATAEVLVHAGFKLFFGEVDKNLCLKNVDAYSLPVHLLGNKAKEGALIYDSAHRIEKHDLTEYHWLDGYEIGKSKALHCYSFYATKNMTTVQGGMIATSDRDVYDWLIKARDHGLDLGTKERYQGRYKQYEVEFPGWRVKGDDLRAAVGLVQLRKLPEATNRRNEIVRLYNRLLGLQNTGNHVYPVLVKQRNDVMEKLYDAGIQTTVHFRPLHLMKGYADVEKEEDLSFTEYIGEHILSLPIYPGLTDEEVKYIAGKVLETHALITT